AALAEPGGSGAMAAESLGFASGSPMGPRGCAGGGAPPPHAKNTRSDAADTAPRTTRMAVTPCFKVAGSTLSRGDLADSLDEAVDCGSRVDDMGARASSGVELRARVQHVGAVEAAGDADAEHVAEGAGDVLLRHA